MSAKRSADRAFRLRLTAYSDPDTAITLCVTLPATYPESLPHLTLRGEDLLRHSCLEKLKEVLDTVPKSLLGSEMIYDIATPVRDILENDVQAKIRGENLPSLEEERAMDEAAAHKAVEERKRELDRQTEDARKEEERMLEHMVLEEIDRQKQKLQVHVPDGSVTSTDDEPANGHVEGADRITFDQRSKFRDEDGTFVSFRTVADVVPLRHGPVTEVSTVSPVIQGGLRRQHVFVIKRMQLVPPSRGVDIKHDIFELETELELVKKLRYNPQPNILQVLDFKVDAQLAVREGESGSWTIRILTDGDPIVQENGSNIRHRLPSMASLGPSSPQLARYSHSGGGLSRYSNEFHELGRLGKGGFGEVFKARNKLDGQLYAVKKITHISPGSFHYDEKVDMWALGVVFFEMCRPMKTGMERDQLLRDLRDERRILPAEFQKPEKALESEIIQWLLSHRPSERPSAAELLRSGKIPLQIEDETIRQALQGLWDANSPHYQKMMSALFAQPANPAKDYTWDIASTSWYGTNELLLQGIVKDKLLSVFRRHGAVETTRPLLFPRSKYYSTNVVQLLDSSGNLLQLPYDLTLPHARLIAKQIPAAQKTFAFGTVYRDLSTGGQPRDFGEVDFDIVSRDLPDFALKEAEVIKVIDEIIDSFPSLTSVHMCYHINHANLLDLIMDFCRIVPPQRAAVQDIISKLNIGQWTWQRIRNELRSPSLGVSSTSLDDLMRFDFRDEPEKALQKLCKIFSEDKHVDRCASIFAHLSAVFAYAKQFNIQRKIYLSPLSSFNAKFYTGGLLFQCLYDGKKRDVFAAGGRFDPKTLRSAGINIVRQLWANDISAELSIDVRSADQLTSHYKDDKHSWIVIIKQDTGTPGEKMLKVKSTIRKEDTDIPSSSLLSWLRSELRERDQREGTHDRLKLLRKQSQPETATPSFAAEGDPDVRVLIPLHKGKKVNRKSVVEAAQARAQELVQSFPIAAIDVKDDVLEQIGNTAIGDADGWRKIIQKAPVPDRKYITHVYDLLCTIAHDVKGETRHAFVYNFRTSTCVYYDLERTS
ncbi:MAG: hypothetical protein M1826_005506 [Phylliscum demangeonii]|nr:MAG: hypothetical protein M1826_005506 [Phylliscum demangeonii]